MVSLSVRLAGVELKNPVIPASGTFGYGREYAELYDLDLLGSFSWKGTTAQSRPGNPQPRIAETASGMLNAVGLQNPGIDTVIAEEVPNIAKIFHGPVIANVGGFSLQEYAENCAKLNDVEQVSILEVNISCPNVHAGGKNFGSDPRAAAEVTRTVKAVTKKRVFMKLSPNVTDVTEIARAVEAAGADAVSLINTIRGMRIDVNTRQPILKMNTGGLSGPAVLPVAVRMVWEVSQAVKVPVLGMGGVSKGEDAAQLMLAGASAVAVGTALFADPMAPIRVRDGLEAIAARQGLFAVRELTGAVRPW